MGINKLKVVLTEEAQAFLDAQPFKAQQKIYYNIFKVEEGVIKLTSSKKLRIPRYGSFALSTMVYVTGFSSFGVGRDFGYCHTWHSQENSENTLKEIAKAEEIRKEYFNNKKK